MSNPMPEESKKIIPLVGPDPDTPEWHAMRLYDPERDVPVRFGASEAAECLNISRYSGGPLEVFLRKRQLKPPFEGNEATEFGKLIEPVVLTMYERKTSKQLRRNLPMYFHGEHQFMAATPDALVRLGIDDGDVVTEGVDAKSSTWRMVDKSGEDVDKFGEPDTDQVPRYILAQAQQQCAVLNLEVVYFPVLINRSISIYKVPRNDDFIQVLVEAEAELAERIIDNKPPEPNWEHPNTKRLLRDLWGFTPRKTVELSQLPADPAAASQALLDLTASCHSLEKTFDSLLDANGDPYTSLAVWQMLKGPLKHLDAIQTGCKNRILDAMQDAQTAILPGGYEVHRSKVAEQRWTQGDVDKAEALKDTVKRAGHERLIVKKPK